MRTHRSLRAAGAAFLAAGLSVASGCTSDDGARLATRAQDEPWFRRAPSRPAPDPPPPPPIVKKELPPGGKDGTGAPPVMPAMPAVDADQVLRSIPGDSSDTVTLKDGMSGFTLVGTTIEASARTAIMAYQGGGPYVGTTLRDCVVHVAPNTVPDGRSFWAFRGYDMSDTTLSGVEITGFGKETPKHDEGHAIYLNVIGPLTLEDCNVHHNGGQGLQLVNRPSESNAPAGPAKGAITVHRTWFHENGFNPDRGAFQVSIFGTGQDVLLEQVEIVAGKDRTRYSQGRTGGALLIEADFPTEQKPAWWSAADGEPPFTQGKVVLDRVLVDHESPNRPLVQIKGCRELTVTGSTFRGGRIALDDPTKPGRASGVITWTGNSGDAAVYVNGVQVGTADVDFTAEDGVVR
jgi:hypothetical protein